MFVIINFFIKASTCLQQSMQKTLFLDMRLLKEETHLDYSSFHQSLQKILSEHKNDWNIGILHRAQLASSNGGCHSRKLLYKSEDTE